MHLFYTALDYAFHNNQGLRHGWAPILKSCLASGHQAPPGRPPPLPRCRRKGNSSYGETCFPLVDGLLCPAPRPPLPCGLASIPLQLQQNFTAHLIGLQIITQPRRECWRRRHIDAHGWAGVARANISHLRGPRGGTVKKDKIVKSWWHFQPQLVHQYARSLMNKYTQPCHGVDALHTRMTLKPCVFACGYSFCLCLSCSHVWVNYFCVQLHQFHYCYDTDNNYSFSYLNVFKSESRVEVIESHVDTQVNLN